MCTRSHVLDLAATAGGLERLLDLCSQRSVLATQALRRALERLRTGEHCLAIVAERQRGQ